MSFHFQDGSFRKTDFLLSSWMFPVRVLGLHLLPFLGDSKHHSSIWPPGSGSSFPDKAHFTRAVSAFWAFWHQLNFVPKFTRLPPGLLFTVLPGGLYGLIWYQLCAQGPSSGSMRLQLVPSSLLFFGGLVAFVFCVVHPQFGHPVGKRLNVFLNRQERRFDFCILQKKLFM